MKIVSSGKARRCFHIVVRGELIILGARKKTIELINEINEG